jgi:hypothetical protein
MSTALTIDVQTKDKAWYSLSSEAVLTRCASTAGGLSSQEAAPRGRSGLTQILPEATPLLSHALPNFLWRESVKSGVIILGKEL